MLIYESQLIANASIGSLYGYLNSKLHGSSAVGSLSDSNNGVITKLFGKASIRQQTFANSFTPDNGILFTIINRMKSSNSLNHIYFSM
jgi:hypothetical protein